MEKYKQKHKKTDTRQLKYLPPIENHLHDGMGLKSSNVGYHTGKVC